MFDFLNTTAMQDSNSRIPKTAETLASMYDSNVGNTSGRTDLNNRRKGATAETETLAIAGNTVKKQG
jgi:hypothetical protein